MIKIMVFVAFLMMSLMMSLRDLMNHFDQNGRRELQATFLGFVKLNPCLLVMNIENLL